MRRSLVFEHGISSSNDMGGENAQERERQAAHPCGKRHFFIKSPEGAVAHFFEEGNQSGAIRHWCFFRSAAPPEFSTHASAQMTGCLSVDELSRVPRLRI